MPAPFTGDAPSIHPYGNFDARKDSEALRHAMKGMGTDEDAIIKVLGHRSLEQRLEIERTYKTCFGRDLIDDIKSETKHNFEKLLVGLLRPIAEFYARELHHALQGLGTKEKVLIEILTTLSNAEMEEVKQAYENKYGSSLEDAVKGDTSGDFQHLMVSLISANRDESGTVDDDEAIADAHKLDEAGEAKLGSDEAVFNMIFCQRSFEQLERIFQKYEHFKHHSIQDSIKSEFSGDCEETLLAIANFAISPIAYFGKRFHEAVAGLGTDDESLIRLVVTRSEVDLQDIKSYYEDKYGKTLKHDIEGDTSGDYKKLLVAIVGE